MEINCARSISMAFIVYSTKSETASIASIFNAISLSYMVELRGVGQIVRVKKRKP